MRLDQKTSVAIAAMTAVLGQCRTPTEGERTEDGAAIADRLADARAGTDAPRIDATAIETTRNVDAPADGPADARAGTDAPLPALRPLAAVKLWAYQIQRVSAPGAVDALVGSRYDMLVIEPTRTDRDDRSFDSAGMVRRLHGSRGGSGRSKIVLGYIDIGEAEDWRTYWLATWKAPTRTARGVPDFLLAPDPDGWAGNYPVAFWDPRWKQIMIHGPQSMLQVLLDDGYDGIYMDWVEAFSDDSVRQAARTAGVDPQAEMIRFIGEIRDYARARKPGFLIVPQNATDLAEGRADYFALIDAIAQEQIYYNGSADTGWKDPASCDQRVPNTGTGYSRQWYGAELARYQSAGLPVFNVEYACAKANVDEAYSLSAARGYIPYVSRRPLDRLTSDPPPGYGITPALRSVRQGTGGVERGGRAGVAR